MHKCHRKLIWKVTLMIIMMNCMTYFIKIIITMTRGFFRCQSGGLDNPLRMKVVRWGMLSIRNGYNSYLKT